VKRPGRIIPRESRKTERSGRNHEPWEGEKLNYSTMRIASELGIKEEGEVLISRTTVQGRTNWTGSLHEQAKKTRER